MRKSPLLVLFTILAVSLAFGMLLGSPVLAGISGGKVGKTASVASRMGMIQGKVQALVRSSGWGSGFRTFHNQSCLSWFLLSLIRNVVSWPG